MHSRFSGLHFWQVLRNDMHIALLTESKGNIKKNLNKKVIKETTPQNTNYNYNNPIGFSISNSINSCNWFFEGSLRTVTSIRKLHCTVCGCHMLQCGLPCTEYSVDSHVKNTVWTPMLRIQCGLSCTEYSVDSHVKNTVWTLMYRVQCGLTC